MAHSVYILQHLLKDLNEKTEKLATKAADFFLCGYEYQFKYLHEDSGGFSTFGPGYGAQGSTWLTAYVFEVFSEAAKLPLRRLASKDLNAYATLDKAFGFLIAQQNESDGCFTEPSHSFAAWMYSEKLPEKRLGLVSHVLSALGSASPALREARSKAYPAAVNSATQYVRKVINDIKLQDSPTSNLSKVVFALSKFDPSHRPDEFDDLANALILRAE